MPKNLQKKSNYHNKKGGSEEPPFELLFRLRKLTAS